MIATVVTFIISIISVISAAGVVRAYGTVIWPNKGDCHSWFAHGICAVFTAFALNALYWGTGLRGLRLIGLFDLADRISAFGAYANIAFMGVLPLWAAYAHLKAKHLALSSRDQREWQVWEMVFYPSRRLALRSWLRRVGPSAKSGLINPGSEE